MDPIQFWLPVFGGSPFVPEAQRARERAYDAWRGQDVVWIVPGLGKARRAREGQIRVLAIDGDHLDLLQVFHVGTNGYVWGPGAAHLFPSSAVTGLLEAWLNASGQPLYRGTDEITIRAPDPKAKGIRYRKRRIRVAPIGAMPIISTNADSGTFDSRWPSPSGPLPVISVEQESRERLGPFNRDKGMPELPVFMDRTGERSILLRLGWDPPLKHLFGTNSSFDDIHQLGLARNVAELSETDLPRALEQTRGHARSYLSTGWSTWEHAHLFPILVKEGEAGALFSAEAQFGISAETLPELLTHPEWRSKALKPLPITRVWGASGLMWALLIERLQLGQRFGHCVACGRLVSRAHGRRFCTRDENAACARRRERVRQAKHRSRKL